MCPGDHGANVLALAFTDLSPESRSAALATKGGDEWPFWSKPAGAKWLLTLPPASLPGLFVRAGRSGAVLDRKYQPSTVSLFSVLCSGFPALWGSGEPHARLSSPLQEQPQQ